MVAGAACGTEVWELNHVSFVELSSAAYVVRVLSGGPILPSVDEGLGL